jgi:HAD superfamily hydrolase (TIGR01490 family)
LQKSIAFFDFDGTITTKDTMLEFARYCHGFTRYSIGICLISPWLIAMKFGLISKSRAKENFLTYFFGRMEVEEFNTSCLAFTAAVVPRLVKQDALLAIKKHMQDNTDIVIVSASAENWVAPWCRQNNLQYICTRLEIKGQKITGKLLGQNCNGPEKVSRIKEKFELADYKNIYCYGDSKGDKQMLQLATHPAYRVFKR